MDIIIKINTCKDCNHLDHSGAFTRGGCLPVCSHNGACYGSQGIPSKSAIDVMIRAGMSEENARKYVSRAIEDNDGEIERLTLENHKSGECYHWAHRVPFVSCDNPSIPEWCPLKNGASY